MSRYIAESVRQMVAQRANYCCEYCHIHQHEVFYPFHIDHIISLKHGGVTESNNLVYSCFPCNLNKGSDVGTFLLPQQVFIRLFNPRSDRWEEHFGIDSGRMYDKISIGQATIKLLKMNEIERIIERR